MARGRHVEARRRSLRRWPMLVVGMLLAGTAAVAQTITGDVYTGCLTKSGDILNVAVGDKPAKECKNHLQIQWNQQGVKGDPGPVGPPGPAGGVLGTYVRSSSTEIGPNGGGLLSTFCDPGDTVTGGGYTAFGLRVDNSLPGTVSQRWIVTVTNESGQSHQLETYVVCADLTP